MTLRSTQTARPSCTRRCGPASRHDAGPCTVARGADAGCAECGAVILALMQACEGVGVVEARGSGCVVHCDGEEYVVRTRHREGVGRTLVMTATVRASAPRLDTWWTRWESPITGCADAGPVAVAELLAARRRFSRMLVADGARVA